MTGSRSLTFSTTRPPRRRWLRALTWAVVVAALVAALVAVAGGLLWVHAWATLGGTEVPSLAATGDEALGVGGATAPDGTTTVLVAFTGDTAEDTPGAPPPVAGPVALVQVGGARDQDAAVLLLPPTLPVTVEGEERMPLADVHAAGGPDLLARTVVDYTEVAVDHLVIADQDALPALVAAVGSTEVCTDTCRIVDADAAREQVTAFAASDAVVDPASDAVVDDGAVIGELAALLAELGRRTDVVEVLTSPLASKRAIDVIGDQVTTDVSLRGAALLSVAEQLAATGEVAVVTLPGVVNPETGNLVVLAEQAATRFALLRDGGLPTQTTENERTAVLADATVAVLNGTGTAGYAADLESRLTAGGVRVVGTEDASNFDHQRSVVRYGPDDPAAEAAAVLLAAELGDVGTEAADGPLSFEGDPVTLEVIGGADLDEDAPEEEG